MPGSAEFDLFIREVVREMTVKAGQKCTAIRKALVPAAWFRDDVVGASQAALRKIVVGDPRVEGVRMGPLVSLAQRDRCAGEPRRIAPREPISSPAGPEDFEVRGRGSRTRRVRAAVVPVVPGAACRAGGP